MLAKDEDLYLKLKKKYLNVERVLNMIADRDTKSQGNINEFLFIKLGSATTVKGAQLDGEDTIRLYIKDEKLRDYT